MQRGNRLTNGNPSSFTWENPFASLKESIVLLDEIIHFVGELDPEPASLAPFSSSMVSSLLPRASGSANEFQYSLRVHNKNEQ